MKQTIRNKTFETNSSSMHSLTITHYDEVRQLLTDADNILADLDSISELEEVISKLQIAQVLLATDLREELLKND